MVQGAIDRYDNQEQKRQDKGNVINFIIIDIILLLYNTMDQGRSDRFKRWFRKERLMLHVIDHGAMNRHALQEHAR